MGLRRILVTGAGGFVGGHLVPALRAAYPDAEVSTTWFEVTDGEAARGAVAAGRPDAVVHLAAVAAPAEARRSPDRAWTVNLHGTLAVARAVLAEAPGAVLLFAGTGDAYGASFRGGRALDETAALAPLNTYGATKAAADLALGAMASEGLRVVRARPFNHTGPGQDAAFVVPAFARQVARIAAGVQAPVLEVGALAPERDFLDVRDVCAAYAGLLGAGLEGGAIVNLASGRPRAVGDVLRALMVLGGVKGAEVRTDAGRLRAGDIPVAAGDAGLARRILGWEPAIAWERTLGDVLEDWVGRVAAGTAG